MSNFERKRHELAVERSNRYVYCGKCHIARKISDTKYICVAPCVKADEWAVWEGDYTLIQGHRYRLTMKRWKLAGRDHLILGNLVVHGHIGFTPPPPPFGRISLCFRLGVSRFASLSLSLSNLLSVIWGL